MSLYSCSKSDASDNATSQICSNVKGTEAIYWDLMNGIPRTDIPGGLPTLKSHGGTYIHPTVPLLTFMYPAGYTPNTDNTSGAVGVNLTRSDNKAVWRYTNIAYYGNTTPQAVVSSEVSQLQSFLESTGTVQTICSQQGTLPRAPGIVTSSAAVLIQFGNFTAVINVGITTETGLGSAQITIGTSAAPTAEFNTEILNTFLPIDYQLLYTDSGEVDSDGDGFADSVDEFPFDPTRH
ncbi:hypothetical protein [Ferruginibacter albus]|uniref:hypothetical protein n=1 Tax=Ferruginibacter albus TaxID=2875540 RepID=UPI001CC5D58A|nr:hypothetical protein [Ferruginibacter albus]UAY53460.1 hypothetical protein K9M53_07240 [Ferruginibacter albus]